MSNTAQDLGQKFTCFKCECKFYDLGSPEPLCPRCGADQRENLTAAPAPSKRKRRGAAARVVAAPQPPAVKEADLGGDDLLDDDFAKDAPPTGKDETPELTPEPKSAPKAKAKKPAAKKAAKKPAAKKAAKKPAAKKTAKKPAAKKAAKK
jgi:hypothetical protein